MSLWRDTARIVIEDHVEIFEQGKPSVPGFFPGKRPGLEKNTKVDAQCPIGHGAHIGQNCLLAEGGRCCRNSRVGDHVWVGVGAVCPTALRVGDGAGHPLGSVVTKEVPAGQTVSGNFAIDHQKFLSNLKSLLRNN